MEIIVHLYIPSTLEFDVAGKSVRLTQESNWPWHGEIKFTLDTSVKNVTMKLRIPAWAKDFRITGADQVPEPTKGYLQLSSEWLASNPNFTLTIPLKPRLIASHPLTNQSTIALARGPIIYCVEDVDNDWVMDHFKV